MSGKNNFESIIVVYVFANSTVIEKVEKSLKLKSGLGMKYRKPLAKSRLWSSFSEDEEDDGLFANHFESSR